MPGHVNMMISSNKNKLEDIVRDMKSFTSMALRSNQKKWSGKQKRIDCLDDGNNITSH